MELDEGFAGAGSVGTQPDPPFGCTQPGLSQGDAANTARYDLEAASGVLTAAYRHLVHLTRISLEERHWAGSGIRSPEHWLTCFAGVSRAAAKDIVQVASRAHELPHAMTAFDTTAMTFHQLVIIARHVPAPYEEAVTRLAPHTDVGQLGRAVRTFPFHTDDTEAADDPCAEDAMPDPDPATKPASMESWFADQRYHLRFEGSIEQGELIEQALREVKDFLFGATRHNTHDVDTVDTGDDDNDCEHHTTNHADTDHADTDHADTEFTDEFTDACIDDEFTDEVTDVDRDDSDNMPDGEPESSTADIADMADIADIADVADVADVADPAGALDPELLGLLFGTGLDAAGKPRITLADALVAAMDRALHAGTADVAGRADTYRVLFHLDTDHHAWTTRAGAIPPSMAAKLTCDGLLVPIWEKDGSPVNVGRTQRIVPLRTRRLVDDRDGGCRFPGCPTHRYIEIHHIVHWADGGTTDLHNLISLCPHHHDRLHAGDFTITPGQGDDRNGGAAVFRDQRGRPLHRRPAPPGTPPPQAPHAPPYERRSWDDLDYNWIDFERSG